MKATPRPQFLLTKLRASLCLAVMTGALLLAWPDALRAEIIMQGDQTLAPKKVQMLDRPIVRLRILDKITARTQTMNVVIGETAESGDLRLRPRACKKNPPIESPESASFLEIWEVGTKKDEPAKPQWIFSGWMFASSPGLSAMDHPTYDVWIIDCLKAPKKKTAEPKPAKEDKAISDEDESGIVR